MVYGSGAGVRLCLEVPLRVPLRDLYGIRGERGYAGWLLGFMVLAGWTRGEKRVVTVHGLGVCAQTLSLILIRFGIRLFGGA